MKEQPPSKKWFRSPKRYFLDAPKEEPGTCFVKNDDYVEAIEEIQRLERQVRGDRVAEAVDVARAAHEPPAEPRPFLEWAADIRTQSMRNTMHAYKAKIQKLEYDLACAQSTQPPVVFVAENLATTAAEATLEEALLSVDLLLEKGGHSANSAARQQLALAFSIARASQPLCECGHDYAQHTKGPVQSDYCRHCPCPRWRPTYSGATKEGE